MAEDDGPVNSSPIEPELDEDYPDHSVGGEIRDINQQPSSIHTTAILFPDEEPPPSDPYDPIVKGLSETESAAKDARKATSPFDKLAKLVKTNKIRVPDGSYKVLTRVGGTISTWSRWLGGLGLAFGGAGAFIDQWRQDKDLPLGQRLLRGATAVTLKALIPFLIAGAISSAILTATTGLGGLATAAVVILGGLAAGFLFSTTYDWLLEDTGLYDWLMERIGGVQPETEPGQIPAWLVHLLVGVAMAVLLAWLSLPGDEPSDSEVIASAPTGERSTTTVPSSVGATRAPSSTVTEVEFGLPEGGMTGSVHGDPHQRTFDGFNYSFQGAGEYILLESLDEHLVVQVRYEEPRRGQNFTLATAVATEIAGQRLQLLSGERPELDGSPLADGTHNLADGAIVVVHPDGITVRYPNESVLEATGIGRLKLLVTLAPSQAGQVRGLLGDFDGNPDDELTPRSQAEAIDQEDLTIESLHGEFGNSWRITPGESLFDYAEGESTDTYTDLSVPSTMTPIELDPETRRQAEAICREAGITHPDTIEACIFDIGATGDVTFADDALAVEAVTRQAVELGEPARAELSQPLSSASFAFDARGPFELSVELTQEPISDDGTCSDWLLAGELWDDKGNQLPAGASAGGPGFCEQFYGPMTVPAAGSYRVVIRHDDYGGWSSPGTTFQVRLFDVGSAAPKSIQLGTAVAGEISIPGETQQWILSVSSPTAIRLVGELDIATTGERCLDFGIVVEVATSGGDVLEVGNTTACSMDENIILPAAGDYILTVQNFFGQTGTYTLLAEIS